MAFDQRIPKLKQIADGKHPDAGADQQLKAIDLLAKYAGLQKIEHSGPDDGEIVVRVIREKRAHVSDG